MGLMQRERESCGREHVAQSTLINSPRTGVDTGHVDNNTQSHKANDPPPIPAVKKMS